MSRQPARPRKRPQSVRMSFAGMLRTVLSAAPLAWCAAEAGLYVAQLNDESAFAVARHLHARLGGVDPAELRTRAEAVGLRAPMMIGVAPVPLLSRTLEMVATHKGRAKHAADLRQLAARGAVPVAILEWDGADVTALEGLEAAEAAQDGDKTQRRDLEDLGGWFRPITAEA